MGSGEKVKRGEKKPENGGVLHLKGNFVCKVFQVPCTLADNIRSFEHGHVLR